MIRPGHHRPLGTLTAPWRFSWHSPEPPMLGDVARQISPGGLDDSADLRRAYRLVGIAETASVERPYRLTFERVAFDAEPDPGRRAWLFSNDPRPK